MQEAVAALRAQTYPADRFEIIAVDNGSSDGTWEWLLEAARQPGVPLACFRNETAFKTHAGSRNVGLRHARGSIIAFTDSDCMAAPDWIGNAVARFRPGLGVLVGRTIPPPNDPVGPMSRVRIIESEEFYDTCNIFYSREAIDRVGGFMTDIPRFSFMVLGEDSELGIRVKQAGYDSAYAAEVVMMHRVREQTLWQWLLEPRALAAVPYLVRKHPVIRSQMLFRRYFLSLTTALFDLALLGALLGLLVSPWLLLLALPLVIHKLVEGGKHLGPAMRVVRAAGGCVRAGVIFGVLLYGSLRFRSLVI